MNTNFYSLFIQVRSIRFSNHYWKRISEKKNWVARETDDCTSAVKPFAASGKSLISIAAVFSRSSIVQMPYFMIVYTFQEVAGDIRRQAKITANRTATYLYLLRLPSAKFTRSVY